MLTALQSNLFIGVAKEEIICTQGKMDVTLHGRNHAEPYFIS